MLLVNVLLPGCKKDKIDSADVNEVKTPVDKAPTTGNRDELTKDSIFLYARQVYLWWDKLPDYNTFKPRNYTSFDDELYAVTRFGINPSTNKPYEFSPDANGADLKEPKYSYITDITQQNPVAYVPKKKSSVDLEGNGNDFGLLVKPYGTQTSYVLYVNAVYPGSPAERAGFKRGDRFNVINGTTIGTNYSGELSFFYDALFDSPNITIEGKTNTNTSFTRSINSAAYKSNPVYKDSVYTSGTKKIGYLAYARFSDENNSIPEFDRVFAQFTQEKITDLILDLRYNGGGYVETAENLINRIIPDTHNGKVMFIEYYNKLMQQKKATILANQPLLDATGKFQYQNGKLITYADVDYSVSANTNHFNKIGSLNSIANVVVIVSSSTASASELVINSLKPYLNVKVVGSTTYGKPVGFFPIRIAKYDLYLSMFETQNSKGEGGYYAGFVPDTGNSSNDDDNPNYDFGNLSESSLAAAYNYLTKGSYTSSVKSVNTISVAPLKVLSASNKLDDREFKGMIQRPEKLQRLK